ncbi:unnamed protein product [Clonostachys rhizophaga]|uniref:Uncharacterized protein n=1 Tax=Clonostachys rhizophaga TaxID=160324 RepID=A0A9N9VL92_9HYPO|nr:unnamed protein product [Clonostachys rhizophaga]
MPVYASVRSFKAKTSFSPRTCFCMIVIALGLEGLTTVAAVTDGYVNSDDSCTTLVHSHLGTHSVHLMALTIAAEIG